MTKLSIITINFNDKEGLRKTIESVLSQSWSNYEHIIIDGGSTDGSVEVIKEYENKIAYWVSERDNGVYNAMNKGIKQSKGMYLQFLNSGDWLIDNTIYSKIFDDERTSDILYGNINNILPDGSSQLQVPLHGERLSMVNFNSNKHPTILHPASFIRKSLFENGLYDERYKIIADIKFFIQKIIIENCTVEYLPFVVTNFNLDGMSSHPENWAKTILERERIFEELLPPRILKDYQTLFQVKDSELLQYIPLLEKTHGLKKSVNTMVSTMLRLYQSVRKIN